MKFFSEDGVDKWCWDNNTRFFLDSSPEGFYVDIGCAHPEQFSNTAFLRQDGFNWDGIAIDGDPVYIPEWMGVPNVHFIPGVVGLGNTVGFLEETTNHLVSRIHPLGTPHRTMNLNQVIAAYSLKAIDFLSIDIEGAEFDVLQTLDFEKWKPKIIVAEYNSMHAGKDYRLVDLLIPKGYALQHMTNSNFVFVAK
jgi:hypothetical protein